MTSDGNTPQLQGPNGGSDDIEKRHRDGVWDPRLQCSYIGLNYNPRDRMGLLWVARGNCTDMTGCIRMFWDIDPDVVLVEVVDPTDSARTIHYRRRGDRWYANGDGYVQNRGPSMDDIKAHRERMIETEKLFGEVGDRWAL